MTKNIPGFTVLIIFIFLAGCRSTTFIPQPTPSHYRTALEACEQIRPAMLDWHEDAEVVYIGTRSEESSNQYIHTDGTHFRWSFRVQSRSALKETDIYIRGEEITVGIDGIEDYKVPISNPSKALPFSDMIDSDKAIAIALESGINADSILLRMHTETFDGARGEYIPLSWALAFADPAHPSQWYWVFIDIVTGEVLRNDFTYTPLPPTLTLGPRPNQLLIRAYGEFDLYVANPQGQSLGIEPNSGEQIAEMPDAWYGIDSHIMTEDNVRLASALIMDPAEGHYRVHLHGPGEREKRCRLSVEMRKGIGEEVLREIEIPCAGGVSLVYEFTLSLAGEEMVSDVTPVSE